MWNWNYKKYKSVIVMTLALLGVVLNGSAQHLLKDVSIIDENMEQSLTVSGFGYYNTTAFDNQTVDLFRKGGYFTNELKDGVHNRLKNYNYLGGEASAKIEYESNASDMLNGLGYYISYQTTASEGLLYSKDLFDLAFYGNSRFGSDTAWLSRTEYSGYAYQKIAIGINNTDNLKIGMSFMNFSKWQMGTLDRAYMYTANDTSHVEMGVKGEFDNAVNLTNPNGSVGMGIGIDFEFVTSLEQDSLYPRKNKSTFVIGGNNIGAFLSNTDARHYYIDTNYRFSGFEINKLSQFQTELFNSEKTKDSLLPQYETKRLITVLPLELYFYAPSDPNGRKLQFVYGFRYRLKSATQALITVGGDYRPTPSVLFSGYALLGGYGYLQVGLSLQKKFNNVLIGIEANNVPGLISKSGYGKSLGIGIKYIFNEKN